MKKLFIIFFIIMFVSSNVNAADIDSDKKDPKLISIETKSDTNKKAYETKISADNKIYAEIKKQLPKEKYQIYRITEKILRANKLGYQNWRIGIIADAENVNAYTTAVNLIQVYSALYDSLYNDEDALAFILSHEISHVILEHQKKSAKTWDRIRYWESEAKASELKIKYSPYAGLGELTSVSAVNLKLKSLYKKIKEQEYEADKEALTLMARAGYNIENANNAMEFIDRMGSVETWKSTHPDSYKRIDAINREAAVLNVDALKKEGMYNIYHSEVMNIKKSSDKKTFIIESQKNNSNAKYVPVASDKKLMEKGYADYLDDDMVSAENNFKSAFKINNKNYVTALYLSYINELQYKTTGDEKELKEASDWVKKANKLHPGESNVLKQIQDIKSEENDLESKK